jgi:hypothetical protein
LLMNSFAVQASPILSLPIPNYNRSQWVLQGHRGALLPHRPDMEQLLGQVWTLSAERRVLYRQYGLKTIPYRGLLFNATHLGNPATGMAFGAGFSMGAFTSSLFTPGQVGVHGFDYSFAAGVGYVSQPFDAVSNPLNNAIGSHFNGMMRLQLGYCGKKMSAHVGMLHFSNAYWRSPNLGINLPYVSIARGLGMSVYEGRHSYGYSPTRQNASLQSWVFWPSFRIGKVEYDLDDRTPLLKSCLDLRVQHTRGDWRQRSPSFGLQVFHDPLYGYEKFQGMQERGLLALTEVAAFGGMEWTMDRWGFQVDLGWYLARPDRRKYPFYEGVGFNYYLNPRSRIMVRLKANQFSADVMEWGWAFAF